MPSSRLLFQLVPLELPTEETASSSSDCVLLQTPTSVQTDEPPEKMRARAERNGYKNGTKFGSLTSQIKYDDRLKDILLPTPRANKVNDMNLNNPDLAERHKANLEEEIAKIVVSQDADDGTTFHLSPLFTEEMMGFPLMWTALPFLSDSGALNPSKPTATP